jgi:hypothetical protein
MSEQDRYSPEQQIDKTWDEIKEYANEPAPGKALALSDWRKRWGADVNVSGSENEIVEAVKKKAQARLK